MIESVLIANRGEIACRILRTARRLGVRTIAVYSDADAGAAHVRLADVAVHLCGSAPRDSYLNIAQLLRAARETGAAAIHPGYGFLSENADFARDCAAQGIVFVGPPPAAIAAMGSKSAAKEAMRQSGVPVLPGYHGAEQSLDALEREALSVGFPLIIKPSGGGGGKGMQIVADQAALRPALESAHRIAVRSFGDATLLLERYLPRPRHVEVQVLADAHGHAIHLLDRDCSVQRRHQKLIEEAPAPDIPEPVRCRLREAALTVARSIGYVNAGTVEFLYSDGEFWFMEMNTRLQVEHPITEAITGLDLVEWQLRIASGEPLSVRQEDVVALGHAVEARVCAEDPASDFTPSAGLLERLDWPQEGDGVRIDSGFTAGDRVPADYDSLLAKVIAFAPGRAQALAKLARAVDQVRAVGVATNANWLARALRTDSLRAGPVSTRFLQDEAAALAEPALDPARSADAHAIAALVIDVPARRATQARRSPWAVADSFRVGLPASHGVRLLAGSAAVVARVTPGSAGYEVDLGAGARWAGWEPAGDRAATVLLDGRRHRVEWLIDEARLLLWLDDALWRYERPAPEGARDATGARGGELNARLPGTVTRVLVSAGDTVVEGQPLLVVEAMKMEHTIRSPHAGRVERVHYAAGERVVEGARLAEVLAAN